MNYKPAGDIPGADERRREQERIRREYPDLYYYAAGVALVVALMIAGYALFPDRDGYLTNLFTEAASVAVTLVILNRMAEARERRRYKQDLIYRMGSRVNSEAIRAVEELRRHEWLEDGSLRGANFSLANLEGAGLEDADLSHTNLSRANLSNANLHHANLSSANLWAAVLVNTNLSRWHKYKLPVGNVQVGLAIDEPYQPGANLSNADLREADLESADLDGAKLEGAMLPNGDTWRPGYDISIFTKGRDWRKPRKGSADAPAD